MTSPAVSAPVTTVFIAYGQPVTQGSIRSLGAGRPSVHGNAKTLKPWRQTVAYAAREAMNGRHEGPVCVRITFCFDKPTSAPKRRRTWPTTRSSGDLDKLVRACFDAFTDAGMWRDDSQCVELYAQKTWTGALLDTPGVVVAATDVTG